MSEYILRDLQRRISNLVRRGRIHSVDFDQMPPRVRVEYSKDAITAWLPFMSGRSSAECSTWEPMTIGEQVIILSESGDLNCGIVLPSLHCSDNPPPSTSPNEHVTRYGDGTTIIYNRKDHKLAISIGGGGDVEINAKSLIINADIQHTGNQTTSGNISSGGEITDSVRSMSADREIYNKHTHNTPHGISQKPNQSQ